MKGRAYKKVCPEKARPEENLRGQRKRARGVVLRSRKFLSSARKKFREEKLTANRSRLVRRDLRELNFGASKTALLRPRTPFAVRLMQER